MRPICDKRRDCFFSGEGISASESFLAQIVLYTEDSIISSSSSECTAGDPKLNVFAEYDFRTSGEALDFLESSEYTLAERARLLNSIVNFLDDEGESSSASGLNDESAAAIGNTGMVKLRFCSALVLFRLCTVDFLK